MSRILFATSEAHPLMKTGGLADVAGSLPRALKSLREDVRLLMPAYPDAIARAQHVKTATRFDIAGYAITLLETRLPGTQVKTWLVDCPALFDRPGNPYLNADGEPWIDNAERFHVLCRVAVEVACDRAGLDWRADLVHCNDWQTGLVPAFLQGEADRPATVFTIHNLAYQGLFPYEKFVSLHLPPAMWTHHQLEFHGQLSFIKGGLVFADRLNTVSPTYAKEIQSPEFGNGLDGLLRHRSTALNGILNGINGDEWNPNRDEHTAAPFNANTLTGKTTNKLALQSAFGLVQNSKPALIGNVGRMVEQKGVDLVVQALPQLLAHPVQVVILGSGATIYEDALTELARQYPKQLAVKIGYDEKLAHLLEAGSDMFLMPSRFEPCGLNQLYSLRYGTLPIVRRVGGLADTVIDASPSNLVSGEATGFVFDKATKDALLTCTERAIKCFGDQKLWRRMQRTAMRQDHSWRHSAHEYVSLYTLAMQAAKSKQKA